MNVYIGFRNGARLLNISLTNENSVFPWNNRDTIFIHYGYGKEAVPLNFHFDIVVEDGSKEIPFVDIAVAGQNFHELVNVKTPHFRKFLSEFPEWADLMTGLASYKSWIY